MKQERTISTGEILGTVKHATRYSDLLRDLNNKEPLRVLTLSRDDVSITVLPSAVPHREGEGWGDGVAGGGGEGLWDCMS